MNNCPRCAGAVVEIEIEQHGQRYIMQSCSGCDTRTWVVDGNPSGLPTVLRGLGDDSLPLSPTAI